MSVVKNKITDVCIIWFLFVFTDLSWGISIGRMRHLDCRGCEFESHHLDHLCIGSLCSKTLDFKSGEREADTRRYSIYWMVAQ